MGGASGRNSASMRPRLITAENMVNTARGDNQYTASMRPRLITAENPCGCKRASASGSLQ